jgi:alkyl hydroperoxide reductase subunit AhpC
MFQPVCTTEIGRLALKYDYLNSIGVKLATLSCDPVSPTALLLQLRRTESFERSALLAIASAGR